VERRGAYRVSVVKTEGREPLGRRRCIWEDNIKMDRREVRLGVMKYFVDLSQDQDIWWSVVNAVMNLRVPSNAGNFLSS
jgi:hypothetical protein